VRVNPRSIVEADIEPARDELDAGRKLLKCLCLFVREQGQDLGASFVAKFFER
jgi:hypothetical protein